MTLLQQMQRLRISPAVADWLEEDLVMWLPQHRKGRLVIPFYHMEYAGTDYLLSASGTEMEIAWPSCRILRLQRPETAQTSSVRYRIPAQDAEHCNKLLCSCYEQLEQLLVREEPEVLQRLQDGLEKLQRYTEVPHERDSH